MLKVKRSSVYIQSLKDLLEEQPELVEEINVRVGWFKRNPDDTRLDNHDLEKKMKGKSAFSITGDIRVVYVWLGRNEVRFLAIGRHDKVYGKR